MRTSQKNTLVHREMREEISKKFNVSVSANRGFFEDERMKSDVGFSVQSKVGSIASYGGRAMLWNEVLMNCYITVPKKDTGQDERRELAEDIFDFFGSRWRYKNFVILDCYDFEVDYIYQGAGDVYKFTLALNIDML